MFTNKQIHSAVLSVFKKHGMDLRINLAFVASTAMASLNVSVEQYTDVHKRILAYIHASNKRGGRYGLASGKNGGCFLRAHSSTDKKFTVLLVALSGAGETFTLSRATDSTNKRTLYRTMRKEARVSRDEMDSLLLFKNGKTSPEVVGFWRAANGDFEGL